MYKTILVEQLIEDGARLLKGLDERDVPVRAAAWFYDPEKMVWKLVIVTPVASDPGPLEAYMRIQPAMTGIGLSFSLDDIIVMSPNSRKFAEFKRTIEGAAPSAVLRPKDSPGGVVFDDAYVYRWLE
jgi:hypothetical protein